jgi:hypothetical protein
MLWGSAHRAFSFVRELQFGKRPMVCSLPSTFNQRHDPSYVLVWGQLRRPTTSPREQEPCHDEIPTATNWSSTRLVQRAAQARISNRAHAPKP